MRIIKHIRTKILLSLLIAALPPYILLSAISFQTNKNEIRSFLTQEYTSTLTHLKNITVHFLRATYINLQTVADNFIVRSSSSSPEEKLQQLKQAEDHNLFLQNLTLLDTSGQVIAATQEPYPIRWKDQPWFQTAVQGNPILSPPIQIPSRNKKMFLLLLPLLENDGKVSGVLSAELFMEHFWEFIDSAQKGEYSKIIIADKNLSLLYHPDHNRFLETLKSPPLINLLKNDSQTTLSEFYDSSQSKKIGLAESVTFNNKPYLVGQTFYFGIFEDRDAAFSSLKIVKERSLLIGALGTFLILIFSILLSRKIDAPIKALAAASHRIAEGSFDNPVNIKTGDELELLGKTFNTMSDTIQRTTISRDYFNNITESLSDSLVITNQNDKILFVNHATTLLSGYPSSELFGKPLLKLFQKNVEHFIGAPKALNPDTISYLETTLIKKDSGTLPVIITRSQIKNNPQDYIEMIYLIKDISERKAMEDDLRLANAALRQNEQNLQSALNALQESHKELQETQSQLIQTTKMSAVGQLAAGIAHEIKNPLAILQSSCELLKRLIDTPSPKVEKILDVLFNHIHRIDKIITELLSFSRKSRQDSIENILIKDLLQEAIDLGHNHDREKRIEFKLTPNPNPLSIIADRTLILQVILNLVINAVDAVDEAGTITLSYKEATVACDDKKYAHIIIEDTGTGIPKEKIDRIFEPFYTTKTVGKGTGLGLSTCYMIIEKYGGSITVKSQEGQGTTFTVTLPAA